jgi:glyoxylase-like metal-dependent hydrolase (beta-lactamase superfamily II)
VNVRTIDLHFKDTPGVIAAYLIPHDGGAILIESGPGSTLPALRAGLAAQGCAPGDITDLFVTHIHLDHAGASGWLARQGAAVHVHPRGLPHLADPSRLLASAGQIYGDEMDALWGEMLPVPADRLIPVEDETVTRIGGLEILALATPGHASHHHAYLVGGTCFSGDVGGVRLAGPRHIVLPMPPPEFHLETWIASCRRLQDQRIEKVAPTHFGVYPDAAAHFDLLAETLADTGAWLEENLPCAPEEDLEAAVAGWLEDRARAAGLSSADHGRYEVANPSHTSAWGIARYWKKYRGET